MESNKGFFRGSNGSPIFEELTIEMEKMHLPKNKALVSWLFLSGFNSGKPFQDEIRREHL